MKNDKPQTRSFGKRFGASGTQIFSGIITAEDYNSNLVGKRAIRQYETMRRSDPTVHQLLMICTLPIVRALWDVRAASDDPADIEKRDFVKHELFERNIMWSNHVREALNMLAFGFSVAEKTYELTEHEGQVRIGLQEIGFRKQNSIEAWETEDKKPGVTQMIVGDAAVGTLGRVSIPMEKLVVYTNEKEGDNYEGISILRYAYKDWDMKDKLGLVLAIGLEKMAIPVPVLGIPEGKDGSQDVENAITALREWRANEEAFIKKPYGWELDKLDMSGQSTKEILPTLQYHDRQIVRAGLAQFVEIGAASSSGSFAASSDQSELYIKALEAVAENVRTTAQREIVQQLCDLNYSDMPNGYPELTVTKIGEDDMATLADAIQKFSSSGLLTSTFETEQHLRGVIKLPELPKDYKDDYDEKREASKQATTNLADGNSDKSLEKEDKNNHDEAKKDPSLKASALNDLRKSRKRAIDIIVGE